VVLLREPGRATRSVHDHHVEGLFPEPTWLTLLERAGFRATVDHGQEAGSPQPAFVGLRPG
jgi:hypothetical protein